MPEQVSETTQDTNTAADAGADVKDTSTAQAAAGGVSADDEMKLLRAELERARKDAAKYRTRNEEEQRKRDEEAGNFKALYEKVLPEVEQARALIAEENERIQAEIAGLPESIRAAFSFLSSPKEKRKLIEGLKDLKEIKSTTSAGTAPADATQAKSTPQPPGAASPAPVARVDIGQEILRNGVSVAAKKFPKEYAEYVETFSTSRGKSPFFA